MKKLILILFLFISSETFPQTKLRGEYRTHWGRGSFLSFSEDGKFDFRKRSCFRRLQGQGYYTVEKDILTLNFINDSSLKDSYVVVDLSDATVNTHGAISDRVTLAFLVIDKINHKPLSFMSVHVIVNSKDTLTAETDWNGKALFYVKKQPDEVKINIETYSYNDYIFKLKPEHSRSIYVELVQRSSGRIKDEPIMQFKILKNSPDGIELRDVKDSSDDDNIYFEKQTALNPGEDYPEIENIDRFTAYVDDYRQNNFRGEEKEKAIADKKDTFDLFFRSNDTGDTIYSIAKHTPPDDWKIILFYYSNNKLVKARIEYRSDKEADNEKRTYYACYYFKDNKLIKSFFEKKKYSNAEDILAEGLRLQAACFNTLKEKK